MVVGAISPPRSRHKEFLAAVIRGVTSGRMVLQGDQRRRNPILGRIWFLRPHSPIKVIPAPYNHQVGSDARSSRTVLLGAWMPPSRSLWSQEPGLITERLPRRVGRASQCLNEPSSGISHRREDSVCPGLRKIPHAF